MRRINYPLVSANKKSWNEVSEEVRVMQTVLHQFRSVLKTHNFDNPELRGEERLKLFVQCLNSTIGKYMDMKAHNSYAECRVIYQSFKARRIAYDIASKALKDQYHIACSRVPNK